MGSKATGIGAYRSAEVLLRWNVVERDEKGRYKKNGWAIRGLRSYTWRGKSGRVVSIELAEGAFRETKRDRSTDIFGEKINDDSIVDPYF